MIKHGIEYQRPTSLNMRILADHVTYSFLAFMKSIFHFCLGCYCGGYSQNRRSNLSSFRLRSKKTSKLRVTGLCTGNSPGAGEFPTQMASYAGNVSIWWRLHGHTIFQRNIERIKRATRLTGNPIVNLHCHRFSVRCSNMSCSFGPSARSIGSRCLVMPPILIDDMSTLVHVKMAI